MKAAFLTGSLISSKGMAQPASRSQHPEELIAHRKRPVQSSNTKQVDPQTLKAAAPVLQRVSATSQKPDPVTEKPAGPHRSSSSRKPVAVTEQAYRSEQKKLKKDKLGRVRMSIRLDPDDHLALKLLAAHSRKSSQTILEEALREYTANHAQSILPAGCDCLSKPFKL
ncbi:hypothetical protein [Sneathiella glossodoripedis]|uniref:hypothetical protein n=1 Tax=Sneathiella glossodoripedis TaxID=418853 RepID=UPI00046EFD55|nr:hypothetical protein [Sneathiella glossodoripedis]